MVCGVDLRTRQAADLGLNLPPFMVSNPYVMKFMLHTVALDIMRSMHRIMHQYV